MANFQIPLQKLLLALLRLPEEQTINVPQFYQEIQTSRATLQEYTSSLAQRGLVTWINPEEITVPLKQRLELVFFALREGLTIEQICTARGWQDFEDLTAYILRQHGFTVAKHVRFTLLRRRYEIDVVGYKDPLIFSVECKRWTHGWRRAAIIKAVENQIERTTALSQSSLTLSEKMKIRIRNETRFLPILVSLSNSPLQFFRKIPIISIYQLNNFLTEGNY